MPAVHECPSCDKKIKIPDGAEGKKLKCPGCQTSLLITEDGLELAQKQAVQSAAKPTRKAAPRDEDDEDEPRAKKRRGDDDEDDDDEPRSKKRRGDDDEDDEDDRPAKKRKKGGMPMWVWLAAGGGGVVVVLIILFVFVLGGGGTKFKEVKKGMTDKQVVDLIGPPMDGDTKTVGQWYNPKTTKGDLAAGKVLNMKESLTVTFKDGKVENVIYFNIDDLAKGFK
jgi:hypothetical protein